MCGAEVAGRDHAQPQGGHGQNTECLLGAGYIGGQAAIRAVRGKVIAGAWAWLLGGVVHGHQRGTQPHRRELRTPPGPGHGLLAPCPLTSAGHSQ
jgi:hypothetical protein